MDAEPNEQSEGRDSAEKPDIVSSRPLVPLQPAQKRHAKHPESGPLAGSTVFKSPRTSEVLKPVARHAFNPWLADPSPGMRARHSAPGHAKDAANAELRGSKSAPDLRAPVLAAIRGLQDGSIQVDVRTRAKIAQAARRVLEAREIRRRTSQEAYQSQGAPRVGARSTEAQHAAIPPLPDTGSPASGDAGGSVRPTVAGAQRSSPPGAVNLGLPRADFRRSSGEELQDDVLLSRYGEPRSGRLSPFTVTTGVPRIGGEGAHAPGSSGSLKQSRTRSTPIPVMPSLSPASHASLPRSLDFVSELGSAGDPGKAP